MSDLTRAEAIKKIKSICHNCKEFPHCVNTDPDCFKALEMAIDSLKTDEAYNLMYEKVDFIEIPEGATNGEVFETFMCKAYPKVITIYEKNEADNTIKPIFSEDWWNSLYRKEQE